MAGHRDELQSSAAKIAPAASLKMTEFDPRGSVHALAADDDAHHRVAGQPVGPRFSPCSA